MHESHLMRATAFRLDLSRESLHVRPWPDPVIDAVGLDPRSSYVEKFWLSVLGPSTTLLMRRFADGLEASPAGFELSLLDTARALGLGGDSRHSPFGRAITRCCQFELAQAPEEGVLAVRRKLPPLSRRQIERLPESLQLEHTRWQATSLREPEVEKLRRRARRLALSLLELGEDAEATERQLMRWRFHPAMCHDATRWAVARRREDDGAGAVA